MTDNMTVTVIMPAYNAAKTLEKTFEEVPLSIVDNIILVDDDSTDETVRVAKQLGIQHVIRHNKNLGYGANQKTCFRKALEINSDIVVMIHPDYQYTPKMIPAMVALISNNLYEVVLGSRILGKGALKGGMPLYKYLFNRLLTFIQNILINQKLSEYHTGLRAYSSHVLRCIPFEKNSDDFLFDNQIITQIFHEGFEIAEISCPTKYFKEAFYIGFLKSIQYGFGVLGNSIRYCLHKNGIVNSHLYKSTK